MAALDEFRRLGARTWANRAEMALRATGQVRQRPDRSGYQVLTPQELEIARLAAVGLSNKQEELARAAKLSVRAVSDLERGVVAIPHRDTVRLLADALQLIGPVRAEFEAVARGPAAASQALVPGVAAATRTLPRDVVSFTGRQRELRDLIDSAETAGAVAGIYAIGGMAGVGKTAFAVHAAHQLAELFPDGQIFLPLHGHTPGQRPVDPSDALASLLLTIGVPAGQLHHHPAWSVTGRAAELAAERDRLDLMATENVSVAAAFDLSYEDLAPLQQLLFRP